MTLEDTLSIQLYSLRDLGSAERQIETAAELGFRCVELIGAHLADVGATRDALAAAGVRAPSAHVGLEELRERPDEVAEAAAALGVEALFMPAVPQGERRGKGRAMWQALGAELAATARLFAERGLTLGYHNHDWEFAPFDDGGTPFEALLEGADGAPLALQADLAWVARAGLDPLAFLNAHAERIVSVHVKDLALPGASSDEDGWADLGKGTLDWPSLYRAARQNGVKGFVLEHDRPSDPKRFANVSRAYALETFG